MFKRAMSKLYLLKHTYMDPFEVEIQQNEDHRSKPMRLSGQYITNINELISEPMPENISQTAANFILSSLYALSHYLFNKTVRQVQQEGLSDNSDLTFEAYLSNVEEEFTIYGKSKKSKSQTEHLEDVELPDEQLNFGEAKKSMQGSFESELVRCYQRVPFVYFQEPFFLDFSKLDMWDSLERREKEKHRVQLEQESLNETLDLVEINLFAQIHRKFHEYFKVVANFDYLRDSIAAQLIKLATSRHSIKAVQSQYVEKSVRLRQRIVQRQNIEKVLKSLKIIKSLKKLPLVVESILKSSLPYDCLQVVQSTKSSLASVNSLKCLSNVAVLVKQCQALVQMDLSKRYVNELYLYLEQCQLRENVDLAELWRKIDHSNCLDKDSSAILDQNRSNLSMSNLTEKSGINLLEELDLIDNGQENARLGKNHFMKRDEGKEYEISMILLQSFQYIQFSLDLTKIKVCNSLRVFVKKFEKELSLHFREIIRVQMAERSQLASKSILAQVETGIEADSALLIKRTSGQAGDNIGTVRAKEEEDNEKGLVPEIVDKISVDFYIKHVSLLNDIFRQTINRFLGYTLTLITEYQEETAALLKATCKAVSKSTPVESSTRKYIGKRQFGNEDSSKEEGRVVGESDRSIQAKSEGKRGDEETALLPILQRHGKFKLLFAQEISLLPGMFKIVQQKMKYLLTLKNISGISSLQFYRWISTLKFWHKYFDFLVEDHPLINYNSTHISNPANSGTNVLAETGRKFMGQLIEIIHQNIKKSIAVMGLKTLLMELTTSYVDNYHKNRMMSSMLANLTEEPWQSVDQIPSQFSQILSSILNPLNRNANASLSILNSSSGSMGNSKDANNSGVSRSSRKDIREDRKNRFQIYKNHIEVTTAKVKTKYKVTLSLMLFCESLEQYVKMSRLLANVMPRGDKTAAEMPVNPINQHIYNKMYDLIEKYFAMSKELILEAKALKQTSFKSKSINAKHLCLLGHCFGLVGKIAEDILDEPAVKNYGLEERRRFISELVETNFNLVINKLGAMVQIKVQGLVNGCLSQEKHTPQTLGQFNKSILEVFVGMVQVLIGYFESETIKRVIRGAFQILIQKYITTMLLKGASVRSEIESLRHKLEQFLRGYFPSEFDSLAREISSC